MGLFSNKKTVDKVINSAISGVDKLFFTKQEKSEFLNKVGETQIDFIKSTINESTARSLTRRYISILIISCFVLLIIFCAVIYGFDKDWASHILTQIKEFSTLALMVAGFYFGPYAISQYIINPLKNKQKKKAE